MTDVFSFFPPPTNHFEYPYLFLGAATQIPARFIYPFIHHQHVFSASLPYIVSGIQPIVKQLGCTQLKFQKSLAIWVHTAGFIARLKFIACVRFKKIFFF